MYISFMYRILKGAARKSCPFLAHRSESFHVISVTTYTAAPSGREVRREQMTAQSPFTMEKQPEAGASRYGHAWHFTGAKVKHNKSFSFPSKDQLYQCHQCRQQAPASGATSKQSPWLAKASRTKAALGW